MKDAASRVVLAPDRSGVLVSLGTLGSGELERALTQHEPPIRFRYRGRNLVLGFDGAASLLGANSGVLVEWDPVARRAVENRARVRAKAQTVLGEVRRLKEQGASAARASMTLRSGIGPLDDHQLVNVAVMTVPDGWGACVFDEQGTGKTLSVIAAFDLLVERNEADVLIVIAPKSMVGEWANEFKRFTGDLYRVTMVEGSRAERARVVDGGTDVVVMNYEAAVSLLPNLRLLAKRSRVVLVVDESFNVKNPEALRTGAVADLREWCTRAYVLCGTPAPNSARDVIAQFNLVDFGYAFGTRRSADDPTTARRQIRKAMGERGVFTRSLKRSVLPDLPSRQFTEIRVELAPEQRLAYQAALDNLVLDLRSITDAEFRRRMASFLERRNALLRICSSPAAVVPGYAETPAKLAALDELLKELVEVRKEKVVLWSFYRASLDALAQRFSRYGIARIDGSIGKVADRRAAIRRFQSDDETMVFLGNPAAAGAGLTLHRARVAVYESLSNQAAHFLQSLDRIHRRGQARDVEYITLLCRGTLEETEYRRLLGKADAQAEILGDPPENRPTVFVNPERPTLITGNGPPPVSF